MTANASVKGCHQELQPLLFHVGECVVPIQPLAEERLGATLDGIHLEHPIHTAFFAGGTEKRQQGLGDSREKQQAVAPRGLSNVGRRQPESEPRLLLVAEGLFDGEPLAVERDDVGGLAIAQRRRQAPRLLHVLRVHDDNGRNLDPLLLRHARTTNHQRASVGRHPFGRRLLLAVGVFDLDDAAEADHEVPAERLEEAVELLPRILDPRAE